MKKPMATSIPACIDPPVSPLPFVRDDPEALEEWIAFRLELDGLEASLQAEHPGYNWKQAMRPHKAEADAAIRRSGAAAGKAWRRISWARPFAILRIGNPRIQNPKSKIQNPENPVPGIRYPAGFFVMQQPSEAQNPHGRAHRNYTATIV